MDLSQILQKLTTKINRSGSGILYIHPNDSEHYYIFTANHCITPNPIFCLVEYEKEHGSTLTAVIDKQFIFTDPKNDFALLQIKKTVFSIDESVIPRIAIGPISNQSSIFHFRGYPAALEGEAAKLEAKFIEVSGQTFKIRTTTSLSDSSGDLAASSVVGFSGSGVVIERDNKPILVGIVSKLANLAGSFNQVHCCSFQMVNELLRRYNLPEIEFEEGQDFQEGNKDETLFSSLLKVNIPEKVFIGEINTSQKELIEYGKREGKYIPHKMDNRQLVYELLKMKGLKLSGDFAAYNHKIISFYDLSQPDNSFFHLVDQGTVDSLSVNEFCSDPDRQRTFVNLLNSCLGRKLHHMGVAWKHEDKTFIFIPDDDVLSKRQIKWKGKVWTERTVFEAWMYPKTNPDEPDRVRYCTHFAFQCNFRQFGQDWYLNIIPDNYATYDGRKKNPWKTEELVSYKKKNERNNAVFTHTRFLAYFLSQNKDFFINFEELVSFENAPKLPDEYWHIKKEKKTL